jgi:hypothetical protein
MIAGVLPKLRRETIVSCICLIIELGKGRDASWKKAPEKTMRA